MTSAWSARSTCGVTMVLVSFMAAMASSYRPRRELERISAISVEHFEAVFEVADAGALVVSPRDGDFDDACSLSLRAMKRISGSKPQRSMVCRRKMVWAASRDGRP